MSPNTLLRNERLFRFAQMAPEPLLRRRTRRTLVVALAAGVTASAAVALAVPLRWTWVLLLPLVLHGPAFRKLSARGTRGLALAPAGLLDERQLQQVHSAYRRAYGIATAALAVLFTVFCLGRDLHPVRVGAVGLFLLVELMIWLPTAVLAWRLPDEDPDEPGPPAC